mgnify:CR=1 FL=1
MLFRSRPALHESLFRDAQLVVIPTHVADSDGVDEGDEHARVAVVLEHLGRGHHAAEEQDRDQVVEDESAQPWSERQRVDKQQAKSSLDVLVRGAVNHFEAREELGLCLDIILAQERKHAEVIVVRDLRGSRQY